MILLAILLTISLLAALLVVGGNWVGARQARRIYDNPFKQKEQQ